ncbi:MAG: hypothetical protein E7012_04945 [Alphaproteobacteria bacterium]|nr:hypothetical protein [Alphaproteobacteria bacterium]
MRNLLVLLFSIIVTQVHAQQIADEDIFGIPTETIKVIESKNIPETQRHSVEFPECNDSSFTSWFSDIVSEQEKKEEESIINKRTRLLAQKYINNFIEQDVSTFSAQENRNLAQIIITTKVNKGYVNSDFKICATDNPILERKVYVLMQRHTDTEIYIWIINYNQNEILKKIYKI